VRLWEKITLGIVVFVISGFIALGVWQSDNIEVVVTALLSSPEQIAAEMNANKKRLEEELTKKHPTVISDFTAEEEKKIIKGEISLEEAEVIIKEKYENKKNELEGNGESKNNQEINHEGSSESNIGDVDLIVGDYIVQLYSIKAYYLGQLGQLEAQVKRDYKNLPKEQKNIIGKKAIVDRYMGVALGYMDSCDAKVEELLGGMESELKAHNGDTSIIGTIREAYHNEKEMKKEYYFALLSE